MAVTVNEAVQALTSLSRDDMLAAIERAVSHTDPQHAAEAGTLLRLALDRDRHIAALTGPATRVHFTVASAYADVQIKIAARRSILACDLLDSSAVAELLGAGGQNKRQTASALRRREQIVGVPLHGRRYVFPAFQFDPLQRKVRDTVARINVHLGALNDPWGVASWWTSAQIRLDGAAPADLLGTAREPQLLTLAGVSADT